MQQNPTNIDAAGGKSESDSNDNFFAKFGLYNNKTGLTWTQKLFTLDIVHTKRLFDDFCAVATTKLKSNHFEALKLIQDKHAASSADGYNKEACDKIFKRVLAEWHKKIAEICTQYFEYCSQLMSNTTSSHYTSSYWQTSHSASE